MKCTSIILIIQIKFVIPIKFNINKLIKVKNIIMQDLNDNTFAICKVI